MVSLDGKRKFLPSLKFQEPNQNSKNFDGQKLNIYYYIVGIKSLLFFITNPLCTLGWQIKLDESRDFLVGIVGFYGPLKGNDSFEALRSITFYTNNGKYGPFGDEIGNAFTSSVTTGKVVGFHGRSGVYLDAIGVHMEYF